MMMVLMKMLMEMMMPMVNIVLVMTMAFFSPSQRNGILVGQAVGVIRPFCVMFSTVIYNVFGRYFTLRCNSNAFSLLVCKFCMEGEITGSWNSEPKRATTEIAI